MEEFLKWISSNPIIAGLVSSYIGVIIIATIYQALIKIFLSEKNIEKIEEAVDKMVDKVQKKDPAAGKLTRQKLIRIFSGIVDKLKEADGCN